MEGGPKLRKWYGQDSSVGAPGAERPDPPPGGTRDVADDTPAPSRQEVVKAWDKQPRRATLVTDVDTALGEAIVVQLIVAKQPVVATGLSADAAAARFGPYVTAADASDLADEQETAYLLRKGVRAVICCGEPGALPAAAARDGKVKHVVVVGSCGKAGVLDAVFGGEDARRKDPKRADAFVKAFEREGGGGGGGGVPALTVVRPGAVRPGLGVRRLRFRKKTTAQSMAAPSTWRTPRSAWFGVSGRRLRRAYSRSTPWRRKGRGGAGRRFSASSPRDGRDARRSNVRIYLPATTRLGRVSMPDSAFRLVNSSSPFANFGAT